MRRRMTVLFAVAALAAAGCGSSSSTTTAQPKGTTTPAAAGPQTVGVQVDGKSPSLVASYTAYFPNEVKARPGDSVKFTSTYGGEPHTVTLGTMVDTALPKAAAAGPNADEPPELKKIPALIPDGPGDAVQTVAQPCFLATGDLPAGGAACSKEQQAQPAFDGTQSFFNSGFLPDQATFTVKLANTIKPGVYNYFCTLHRAGMSGKITVVDSGQTVPPPAQVTQEGQSQLNALVQKLQPTETALKAGTLPPFVAQAKPDQALAGGGTQDIQNALVNEFGPPAASVPVGGSLTWTVLGPHTISFNAPASAQNIINKTPDGAVHLNQEAGAPAGGPGVPPPSGPPPSTNGPPPPPTVVDGGSFDGTSFHSSGIILSFPPALTAYKLTFQKAGTYNYVCLIHPDMKGTVKVG